MARAKKSVVYKADTAGLTQIGTALRPLIATAMESARTVHGKVHNLDWLGQARDAALNRADRELVQDRRVGETLGTLADAYVKGAEAMQPMIDTLRRDWRALEDDGFSVSEDWEVKDTYNYDFARTMAPLFGMSVADINDLEAQRATEAANATARLQPLADELGTADANTKTAITNAVSKLDTNTPQSASTNPAATPGAAPGQASVVKTSATAPGSWQDMVLPPHLRDTAGQPTVGGDVAGKPLSAADAAAAHAQLRQSLATSGMSPRQIDELMAKLPSPEAAAAMLGTKFSPTPQTDKPRAEPPGFADRLKDASLRFDEFGRNIGDGLADTAEASIDAIKGLPNLVGLGGDDAPGVLDSWKAVGEGILGTPEAIVKEVTDVANPPEGSTWDRELGQVLPEALGAAGLGKAALTHAFEHAARDGLDGLDGLPVAETKPTTATNDPGTPGAHHTPDTPSALPSSDGPPHHSSPDTPAPATSSPHPLPPDSPLFDNYQSTPPGPEFTKPDGNLIYPDDSLPSKPYAVQGTVIPNAEIPQGTVIDRFGHPGGSWVSPEGVPFAERALPPDSAAKPYYRYEVGDPTKLPDGFRIEQSQAAPWFHQPGGGIQYRILDPDGNNASVKDLLDVEYLREVNR